MYLYYLLVSLLSRTAEPPKTTTTDTHIMSGPPPPPKSGMSLYANLLEPASDPSATASISRAPVLFKQPDEKDDAASKKPLDPGATHSLPEAYCTMTQ